MIISGLGLVVGQSQGSFQEYKKAAAIRIFYKDTKWLRFDKNSYIKENLKLLKKVVFQPFNST